MYHKNILCIINSNRIDKQTFLNLLYITKKIFFVLFLHKFNPTATSLSSNLHHAPTRLQPHCYPTHTPLPPHCNLTTTSLSLPPHYRLTTDPLHPHHHPTHSRDAGLRFHKMMQQTHILMPLVFFINKCTQKQIQAPTTIYTRKKF